MATIKKIVISPNNTKAVAFFDDLNRRKSEIFDKIERLSLIKRVQSK